MGMTYAARRVARQWGRFGVTTRLMAVYTVILALAVGAIIYQSDRLITQRLNRALTSDLTDEIQEYAGSAAERPAGQSLTSYTASWLRSRGQGRVRVLLDLYQPALGPGAAGLTMTTPGAGFISTLPHVGSWLILAPSHQTLVTDRVPNGTFRILAGPLDVGGRTVGTYVAVASTSTLNSDRRDQLALAVFEGVLALLAAIGGGYLLLRRALRTVNNLTKAAEEARKGDLTQRVAYAGPDDEVGRLARTMDEMLAQLDTSFTAQRRLLADVSHQLRTPLTVARGHLEVLARSQSHPDTEQSETITLVIDELTQMSLMAERLLLLGQALEPDFLLKEPIDLSTLLDEVYDAAQVMATRHWILKPAPDITFCGDPSKLRGALLNLIDNAVKATNEDGTIEIGASVGRELTMEVADDGHGISAENQLRVFDRFRRFAATSAGGSGLGLAIVKAVAEAHGGRVELTSAAGQGCRVRIHLPPPGAVATGTATGRKLEVS
jgi:two-component system OmpR family sensor kinase